jgi:hypothetical protein
MINRKLADIDKGQKLVALAERETVQPPQPPTVDSPKSRLWGVFVSGRSRCKGPRSEPDRRGGRRRCPDRRPRGRSSIRSINERSASAASALMAGSFSAVSSRVRPVRSEEILKKHQQLSRRLCETYASALDTEMLVCGQDDVER